MTIKHLDIHNFRGIKSLSIDFSGGMNLFIGNNGAGKSTVIDALRILLSWFIARMANAKGQGTKLTDADITRGANYCLLRLITDDAVEWQLFKQRSTYRQKIDHKTDLKALNALTDKLVNEMDEQSIPMIAAYSVNRAVTEIPLRLHRHQRLKKLDAYDQALDGGVNFRSFFEWFREREDIENEHNARHSDKRNDSQLQAVRDALGASLPEFSGFHVRRSPRAFVVRKNGKSFDIRQMSDGEKCYITLVGDIARRLAMTAQGNIAGASGIVLIDEVDLHLHPQWQQTIVERLRTTFPQCQFMLTTHSPFIVSSLHVESSDSIHVMKDGEATAINTNTYGQPTPDILLRHFDMPSLRTTEVATHINNVWALLSEHRSADEQFTAEMDWLRSHLAPSDIEFAKINLELLKQHAHD